MGLPSRTNMAGNMARKLGWAALSLALMMAAGCQFSIERQQGIGESCRQNRECKSGLDCVNRLCVARPPAGDPELLDASINASPPEAVLKPPVEDAGPADAATDASADASTDGG